MPLPDDFWKDPPPPPPESGVEVTPGPTDDVVGLRVDWTKLRFWDTSVMSSPNLNGDIFPG